MPPDKALNVLHIDNRANGVSSFSKTQQDLGLGPRFRRSGGYCACVAYGGHQHTKTQ